MNEVLPLFSNPVFISRVNEGRYFPEIVKYCKTLEFNKNSGGNYASIDTKILDQPIFTEIKRLISDAIIEYTKDIMVWTSNDFYITQSWLNVNPPGSIHHTHYHYNSILSGTFYVQTTEDDSILFNYDAKETLKLTPSSYNIWNSDSWSVPVTSGMIVLFPSKLMHGVKQNTSNIERISIAFNTFVKGQLGTDETLTLLDLS